MRDRITNRGKYMSFAELAREYSEKLRREESIVRPRRERGSGREHKRDRDVGPSR